jgi:hypothetical protein
MGMAYTSVPVRIGFCYGTYCAHRAEHQQSTSCIAPTGVLVLAAWLQPASPGLVLSQIASMDVATTRM